MDFENTDKTIRMTRQMVIDQMLAHCSDLNGLDILEPSAGSGNLVEGILRAYPTANVDCVELNKDRRDFLRSKGLTVVGSNFFQYNPVKKYDYIIACPTYKDNVDVKHIMRMYTMLKEGGYIISLTSPYWTIRNSDVQVEFREWLEDKSYSMVMLKDKSFVEEYETQPSMIIKIKKV